MPASEANDVLAAWEASSQYWSKHQALIETMFAPLTRALIEAAEIREGQMVLDIGGGSGEPSLTISPLLGASGSVTYTDPSMGMLKTARSEADRRKLTNITFQQASAEHLPFPKDYFDVAVGRLSTMFFSEPLLGLREIHRVVKPGAVISFVVWSSKDVNPFFNRVTEVLDIFVVPEPEDDDAPGAFRFAKPGKLSSLLIEAGASTVSEQTFAFDIEAPIDPDHFWELRSEMSDTLREKLAKLRPEQVDEINRRVKQRVKDYFAAGEMSFPAQVLVVTGKKMPAE